MKKIPLICLLCLLTLPDLAQKVSVEIVKVKNTVVSEWQILDENYQTVFPGNEYFRDDSVFVSLEANRRYLLQISIPEINNHDTPLYSLLLDNSPILVVRSDTGPGDYFYPFFTGTRTDLTKIVGGTTASISEFPWQIYLEAGDYLCGGSIISPGWVVTAAHCVRNSDGTTLSASKITITAGATNPISSQGTKYSVSQVIINENYNSTTYDNDIALLKVNGPINCQYCQPIKLIKADNVAEGATDPGVITWITGWGLTNANAVTEPANLQKAQVPIVSNSAATAVWENIPASDIMAGYINGNKDACSGDSGGPMSIPVSGEYRLGGIVSWGSSKCNTYGAYTRVSMFESWIKSKTGIVDFAPDTPVGDTIICEGITTSYYSTNVVSGATAYEWVIYPSNAGTITGSSENARVDWNPGYSGGAYIKVRVTLNNTYSEWAKRTVIKALTTKITSQTGDTISCEGKLLLMKVQATGTNLIYNWFQDGNSYPETSDQISFQSLLPSNSGMYKCQVSGLCGSQTTNTMNLTVYPLTRISSISPDITADYGIDITLSVNASGHDLIYQWKHNNISVENSDSPILSLENGNAQNIGLYWAIVSGTCGTEISDSTYVYLNKEQSSSNPGLTVWPTFTSDVFNVAISTSDTYSIQIFSLTGKIMNIRTNCHYQTTLNISAYPKGFYIIKITGKNLNKSVMLVKE